jgi:hypothetical protein
VLAALKKLRWTTLNVLLFIFTICNARVSALMLVLSDNPYERMRKWRLCPILKENIVGARLTGISVIKTAMLLDVLRATVSKVMLAYTNHGKTTSAKSNSGRKSTLTERDRRTIRGIVSKNHRTTAAQVTTELNIHLEDLFSQKLPDELHKSNIHGRAAIAKPLLA